jgi:hypothetical protein
MGSMAFTPVKNDLLGNIKVNLTYETTIKITVLTEVAETTR